MMDKETTKLRGRVANLESELQRMKAHAYEQDRFIDGIRKRISQLEQIELARTARG